MSNVTDTSRQAYHNDALPTLSERQAMVMRGLEMSQKPNMTNSEIASYLEWPINTVTPRIFELRGLGKVVSDGKRTCNVTGRTAYAWRLASPSTLF